VVGEDADADVGLCVLRSSHGVQPSRTTSKRYDENHATLNFIGLLLQLVTNEAFYLSLAFLFIYTLQFGLDIYFIL
jgi:uncharacterized membrane protein